MSFVFSSVGHFLFSSLDRSDAAKCRIEQECEEEEEEAGTGILTELDSKDF